MSPEPVCLEQEIEQGWVYMPLTLEMPKGQALSPTGHCKSVTTACYWQLITSKFKVRDFSKGTPS